MGRQPTTHLLSSCMFADQSDSVVEDTLCKFPLVAARKSRFSISGDVDFASSRQLRHSVLREIQENRTPQVVVNLSAVRYIDSSVVASLVEALKASRNLGVRFILFGLSTPAREVLQLSRLIKVFEIYETEDQAAAP